ncbi:MAG: hypothetical protein QNK11_04500 [Legionella sp.]|nr:hypothetical protein [Legionella sp.]
MRNKCLCISFGLLLSSVAFSEKKIDCAKRIPDSRNFIISGKLFRKTIYCLEHLIEAQHASTIELINAKNAVATIENNASKTKEDVLTAVSVQLISRENEKKVLAFSFTDHLQKSTFELALN